MSRPENTVFWVLVVRFAAPSSISRLPLPQDGAGEEGGKSPAAAGAPHHAAGQALTPLLFPLGFRSRVRARQTINRCFLFVCLTAMAALFCFLALGFIEFNRIETPRCQKC